MEGVPGFLVEHDGVGVGYRLLEALWLQWCTLAEQLPLVCLDVLRLPLDCHTYQERVQLFVLLKQSLADICEHDLGYALIEFPYPQIQNLMLLCLF